jgi:putative DNA methylase
MTKPYKKKLIEVAIPLEAINAASAREKSIRHGHPSTLHLWWARRPLAACRAVLFAQLVDDPSSLPDQFPTAELQDAERKRLFAIIEELVLWENSTNEEVLERARAEIRRSCGGVLPPIYDPFSGGGSIPLEAQRLGLPAYGSDLNPVAVMIGKAMIEIPPKFKDMPPIHPGPKARHFYRNAEGLAEDVKYYGEWMRGTAWERIGYLYPQVDLPKEYGGGKATVIAWIWARTVPSPDPAFADVQVPVTSSFLLSTKVGREAWIEPIVSKQDKTIYYRIRHGGTRDELAKAKDGTKSGQAMFRCLFSDSAISGDYVDKAASRGEMGVTLLAVVAETKRERVFIEAASVGDQAVPADVSLILDKLDFENLEVPCRGTFASNAQGRRYGFHTFKDYFTKRQLVALGTYADLVNEVQEIILRDALAAGLDDDMHPLREGGKGVRGYAEAIAVYLSFGVSRLSDIQNSLCRWESSKTQVRNLFGRQAIPMMWDFGENNVFGDAAGDYRTSLGSIVKVIERFVPSNEGSVRNADAQANNYPDNAVISTDPPYYDNIEYADLSDFFYVWLRKALKYVEPTVLSVLSTPKAEELVATRYRHGGQESADLFFLNGMRQAVKNMADHSSAHFPATIYYAFKQSEIDQEGISSTGWATFLQAVIEAGYSVVGTWPMRTEMANRMVASGTNALANSVVLVCRKKEASAETITRAEFIRALKRELPSAIMELQAANIAPADMPQSAIGPGMGVFSRYRAVLESDDSPMSVKSALQLINRELDEYLGGIQGEFDADTRFAITWFEQNGLKSGDYGTANNIATARGITVESVKHARIVESQAGKVRVLRRDELDDNWEPGTDQHLTIWECLQHLVRLHEKDGISHATAILLKKIGEKAEAVKDLAYILYDISANKRQDAKEATAYNALIADWTELSRQAAAIYDTRGDLQQRLDL